MESEWPTASLEDLTEFIVDCPHSTPQWTEEGEVVLRSQNIRNGRLDLTSCSFTTVEGYAKRTKRAVPAANDLVLTREAPMGEVCIIPAGLKCCLGQRMVLIRADEVLLNSKYLLYVFQGPFLQHQIGWSEGTGTTVSNIRIPHIKGFIVPLPSLPEQKAIAHILGSLDDRIELNRRMNETFEGMAQALFKSWFVDFDPVIDNALVAGNPIPEELTARAELRRTALDNGTANRETAKPFPDAFVETEELGWIPEGWRNRAVSECFQLLGGHSFKSGDYRDDGHYGVVTIKNVQDGGFIEACTNRITAIPPKMKEHCRLNAGDILLSLTGNVGRICAVSSGKYLLNQRVAKVRANEGIANAFGYFFFRQRSLFEKMLVIAKGTAQQNLSPIETGKLSQILPCNGTIEFLSPMFSPWFDRMVRNTVANQALRKLRDTLLPKLISGELRIPDAEKLAEAALA